MTSYLHVMVNLSVKLTELRDAQIPDKTLHLSMFVRVFSDEIWIGRLSKDTIINVDRHCTIDWGSKWNKVEKGRIFPLLELWYPFFPAFTYRCSWFLDPGAPNKDLNHCLPFRNYTETTPPASLALTFADNKLWDFLPSIILWAKSYNKYAFLSIY